MPTSSGSCVSVSISNLTSGLASCTGGEGTRGGVGAGGQGGQGSREWDNGALLPHCRHPGEGRQKPEASTQRSELGGARGPDPPAGRRGQRASCARSWPAGSWCAGWPAAEGGEVPGGVEVRRIGAADAGPGLPAIPCWLWATLCGRHAGWPIPPGSQPLDAAQGRGLHTHARPAQCWLAWATMSARVPPARGTGSAGGGGLTDSSSVSRSSSMRDCASAYVSAARLRITLLVNWLDTTCGGAAAWSGRGAGGGASHSRTRRGGRHAQQMGCTWQAGRRGDARTDPQLRASSVARGNRRVAQPWPAGGHGTGAVRCSAHR